MKFFLISCGGTGGHLSPGVALAQELQSRGHKCKLVISKKLIDKQLLNKYPDIDYIQSPGVGFSLSPIKLIHFIFGQLRACLFSMQLIQQVKPDMVIGFGGFTTVAVGLMGFLMGYPLILHEANRRPGKAIRILSGLAQRIYLPDGVQLRGLPPQTLRHFGYPIRDEIRLIPKEIARKNLGLDPKARVAVIVGGSQGARSLTNWARANHERFTEAGVNIYCIAGMSQEGIEEIPAKTIHGGVRAKAVFAPFSDAMSDVLSSADIAVSRAGAGSIAEFIRCRVPSILVPYPYASDNHQQANAKFLERQGGSVVLADDELDNLAVELEDIVFNDWLIQKFRTNLDRLDRYNCLTSMADDILSCVKQFGGKKTTRLMASADDFK